MKNKHSGFSGSLGFVLAAAGSAVGVGNIWRFPYLCAKDGGGLFLLVYLVLVLTFGFTLLTTDVAIGRRTKLYSVMMRYVVPVVMLILFLTSTGFWNLLFRH